VQVLEGPKDFAKAIDQLMGYLVWQDTDAGLILFIKKRAGHRYHQEGRELYLRALVVS
jgi:hypothetical protein